MAGLVPDLQHILFWMSNSVELLYFIQQKCPLYMQSLEEELDVTGTAVRGSGLRVRSPHCLGWSRPLEQWEVVWCWGSLWEGVMLAVGLTPLLSSPSCPVI